MWKEKWKTQHQRTKENEHEKSNLLIWHFSLGTHFLMHHKRLSAVQWHSSNVYLSVRMPVSYYTLKLTHWLCYMQSKQIYTSRVSEWVWVWWMCVILFSLRCVCNYRSQINQYKANNQIVYIIYLSGMIQQVHLCICGALYPSHHYHYRLRLSLLFHVFPMWTEMLCSIFLFPLSLFLYF